jgi:hypothetical protein
MSRPYTETMKPKTSDASTEFILSLSKGSATGVSECFAAGH